MRSKMHPIFNILQLSSNTSTPLYWTRQSPKSLTEFELKYVLKGVLQAIDTLHQGGIVHTGMTDIGGVHNMTC